MTAKLFKMGFKVMDQKTGVPNTRYLWKKLLAVMRKGHSVLFKMHVDKESGKNVSAYKFLPNMKPDWVVYKMGLIGLDAEEDWGWHLKHTLTPILHLGPFSLDWGTIYGQKWAWPNLNGPITEKSSKVDFSFIG